MPTRWVRIDGPAQAELQVDRRRDADDLGDLVIADEAANVVGTLDVDIERRIDRGADRRDLPERQVRRQVDRARAEFGDHARGRGKSRTSPPAFAPRRAISSSSSSVCMKTPLPCDTRTTGTPRR